jgi:CheY-like chemotaxis protein
MKTILIVDDDPAVIEVLGMRLRGQYRTLATTSPQQAIRMALDKRPDLVLCDFDMPAMNGVELAKQIRAEFAGRIPVVYLTSLVTPAEARAGAMKGEQVIAKQAPISELLACIKSLIGE